MRLVIAGSRNCQKITVDELIQRIPDHATLILSGGAQGIDTLARQAARQKQIAYREFLPDYQTFGKRAPLVRNKQMAELADCALVFWDGQSRGTADMIAACIDRQIPVDLVLLDDHAFNEEKIT